MSWNPFEPSETFDENPIMEKGVYDGGGLSDVYKNSSQISTPGTGPSGASESWCADSLYNCIDSRLADSIYFASLVARTACEIVPRKAFALFKGWKHAKNKAPDWVHKAELQFVNKILPAAVEAGILARQYSDAYIILFWDDDEPDKPFNPSKATRLLGAFAKSRCTLTPEDGFAPETATMFVHTSNTFDKDKTEAEIERQRGVDPYMGYERFHSSRIIHVPGLIASKDLRAYREGYNLSVFDYLDRPLREWIAGKYAVVDMLKTHSPFVYKLKHLAMKSLRKQYGSLWNRFRTILDGMRYMGGLILDKDQEDAQYLTRSYSGADKMAAAIDSFMSSNSDVPQPYLIDKESAFSADNLSARYEMAGILKDYTITHINPIAAEFLKQYAAVYQEDITEEDLLEYAPHYGSGLELTRMEQAEIYFRNAQADVLYLAPQVLNNETVQSRWRDGDYHDDLVLTGKLLSSKDVKSENEQMQQMQLKQSSMAAAAASSKPGKNSSPAKEVNAGGPKKKKPQNQ